MRTKLVMSLVYMIRYIENTEDEIQREVLKDCFYDLVKEIKLTDKERHLFEFEANNIGI